VIAGANTNSTSIMISERTADLIPTFPEPENMM